MPEPTAIGTDYSATKTEDLRAPPYDLEAEKSVLGGLLVDNDCWEKIADKLVDEDFHIFNHRLIFRAIEELADNNEPFDVITLSDRLRDNKEIEDAGNVLAYLAALANDAFSAAGMEAHARIVREKSTLRKMIRAGNEIATAAMTPEGRKIDALLDEAEQKIFQIADRQTRTAAGLEKLSPLLKATVGHLADLSARGNPVTGLATGFGEFDEQTAGLQPGELIIIAGRPSMGKTSLAMNIAETTAMTDGKSVAIFSMEMPARALALRMISSLGRVDQQRVRTGRLVDNDWARLTSAVTMLEQTNVFVDDSAALSPTEIRARARRLKRERGLALVVVDYLQLMRVAGTVENRATEISEISRSLKALAKELNIPVVALSQLNRSLEQRTDKRPIMSDLRESGAIEQDADLIVFIYRDEVYNEDSPDKNIAEIIVAKQRNGPIFKTRLTFLGQYIRFENYAPEQDEGGYFGE